MQLNTGTIFGPFISKYALTEFQRTFRKPNSENAAHKLLKIIQCKMLTGMKITPFDKWNWESEHTAHSIYTQMKQFYKSQKIKKEWK